MMQSSRLMSCPHVRYGLHHHYPTSGLAEVSPQERVQPKAKDVTI
jgi:hypothetical protein